MVEQKPDLTSKEKEEEKKKYDEIIKDVEAIKEKASVEYKKGMYEDAVVIYE